MGDADKPSSQAPASCSEDDLENLLDDALNDFDKPLPKVQSSPSTSASAVGAQNEQPAEANIGKQWSSEFKQFQDVMEAFLNEPKKEFAGLDSSDKDAATASDEFSASLTETLRAMSECTQSIPEPTPEELAQLFNSMNVDDGESASGEQFPDILPLMQNVMQSLLSKELLYPALKDLVSKYPDWLAANKGTLDKNKFDNYDKQYRLMKEVCDEFENRTASSDEEKAKSFQKILTLMQKMQECGNPPKDLIGDVSAELAFDEQGNIKLPGMPEQCVIM